MTRPAYFPRRIILAAALVAGLLLALAVHILGQRFGLDLGGLWSGDGDVPVATGAAIAWWLIGSAAFISGHVAARLMAGAAAGRMPPRLRQLLIGIGVLTLAAVGQMASVPNAGTSRSGVLASLAALTLGAVMAFSGAQFALRRSEIASNKKAASRRTRPGIPERSISSRLAN